MAGSTTTWPAAVSERSAALVHGSPREATVLAAFPTALYLQVGGHADVLPVVTRHGLRLPTALAVATDLPTVGWGAQPGDEVVVGDGAVRLPGVTIRAVRSWRPHAAPRAASAPLRRAALDPDPAVALAGPSRRPRRSSAATTRHTRSRSGSARSWAPARDSPRAATTSCAASSSRCGCTRAARPTSWPTCGARWSPASPRPPACPRRCCARPPTGMPRSRSCGCSSASRRSGLLTTTRLPVAEAVGAVLAIGHTSGADLLGGLAGCLDALSAPRAASGAERGLRRPCPPPA